VLTGVRKAGLKHRVVAVESAVVELPVTGGLKAGEQRAR
jgi:hypothetical protein